MASRMPALQSLALLVGVLADDLDLSFEPDQPQTAAGLHRIIKNRMSVVLGFKGQREQGAPRLCGRFRGNDGELRPTGQRFAVSPRQSW